MNKRILIVVLLISFSSFGQKKQTAEDKITDKIFELPEIKEAGIRAEKYKKHFAVIIAERPDKMNKYYWVKAGEDDEIKFTTLYHFYVDSKTLEVFYYDVLEDSLITLKQWRNERKTIH